MTTRTSSYSKPNNRRPKGRFYARRKVCAFCVGDGDSKTKEKNLAVIDYKDAELLRKYVSDRHKIETKRKTGTCSKCQRSLATAIKRARFLALLSYTPNHRGSYTGTR